MLQIIDSILLETILRLLTKSSQNLSYQYISMLQSEELYKRYSVLFYHTQ